MGRKAYFKQENAYKGAKGAGRNAAYLRSRGPHGSMGNGPGQRELYKKNQSRQAMAARRSAPADIKTGPGAFREGTYRPSPGTGDGAYGTRIENETDIYGERIKTGHMGYAGENPGAVSYKEKEIRSMKEELHVKQDEPPLKNQVGDALPLGHLKGGERGRAFPQGILPVKGKAGYAPGMGKEGNTGPGGHEKDAGDDSTEELKRKLHVKFPQDTDTYFKHYAQSRMVNQSAKNKRETAKERSKEYYKKRRRKEEIKRRMGFSRHRPRGYSQYLKEFKKELKRQRKDTYKGRRDAARAQMKEAFKKSSILHLSKTLGAAAGSYEEDMQRNSMGFFTAFASGAFKYAGKEILNILAYAFSGVLSALLPLILLLLPFLLIFLFLMSFFTTSVSTPELYFNGGFSGQAELKAQGDFIDNAIQTHYDSLDTQIRNFKAADQNNTVVYVNGYRYNKNSVLAVYFSILCTRDDYDGLYQKKNKPYPPYLFADTDKEKNLLKEIFGQMNYVKEIQVSYLVVTGIDAATNTPILEVRTYKKLMVYNLTISQWLSEHPHVLSKKAKGMLELLKKYENMAYSGGSGYTPLGDITMPDGVDENLVYMAATLKAEAVGEPEEGQIAVGFVIWNRAGGNLSGAKGACLAPGQFSCWDNGSAQRYLAEYSGMSPGQLSADQCYRVCVAVTTGQTSNPIGTKRYYCNPNSCSGGYDAQMARIRAHNSPEEIQAIGNHVFCEHGWW